MSKFNGNNREEAASRERSEATVAESGIRADNLEAARRLNNFPSLSFLLDFLVRRHADHWACSYDFIVKAPADSSDLDYLRQTEDITHQLTALQERYPDQLLHQLGPQCYRPDNIPNPDFIQYIPDRAPRAYMKHAIGFYLNPRLENQLALFIDLIDEMEADQLDFAAKTINRCRETRRSKLGSSFLKIRTEGLVVTASASDADRVLEIILNRYCQQPVAFVDRPVPALAARLAPGIAVGTRLNLDGVDGQRESFNGSRSSLLDSAYHSCKYERHLLPADTIPAESHAEFFRQELQSVALARGIDPKNLAFEKR